MEEDKVLDTMLNNMVEGNTAWDSMGVENMVLDSEEVDMVVDSKEVDMVVDTEGDNTAEGKVVDKAAGKV